MPEFRSDPVEQRFDRLVSAGRQLVDGVSGARPGSRSGARSATRGDGRRARLDGLGRWVENKLDWILEDDDDWREPWQEARPEPSAPVPARRRPLDAISRRTAAALPTVSRAQPSQPADPSEWPDDETFTVPRWQRQASSGRSVFSASPSDGGPAAGDGPTPGRALPRSTRRR
ncbi:hypothetical protein KBY65_13690 [Cyanobium sp. Alchichica 3B3-8F6]|uniref:hypothetical protein n=1 Tax=Cyanobium sp. Alchichica 3B3-8F6 TaxID=2823696 RepID=UPI0020CE1F89|nr:hypothetical protein [Cyanobium sp. Alchichica 3B3-8F6]MCP9883504.1 hypothetical protein [Cyanobium sp. Alchichica 3B3-8F6]